MATQSTQGYLIVSAAIFGVVAIIHLVRALNRWAFDIGPVSLPIAASWIGFLVTAGLAIWAVRLLRG
jgi:hypothetical protein